MAFRIINLEVVQARSFRDHEQFRSPSPGMAGLATTVSRPLAVGEIVTGIVEALRPIFEDRIDARGIDGEIYQSRCPIPNSFNL